MMLFVHPVLRERLPAERAQRLAADVGSKRRKPELTPRRSRCERHPALVEHLAHR